MVGYYSMIKVESSSSFFIFYYLFDIRVFNRMRVVLIHLGIGNI